MAVQLGFKEKSESGFTLIELLVVILIIGILAGIAIPLFINQRQAALDASLKEDAHTIKLAMESCRVSQTNYPDVFFNWAGVVKDLPPCIAGIQTSAGTRYHAFDLKDYYTNLAPNRGEKYCIEIQNAKTIFFFRSDIGVASSTVCQNQ